MKLLTYSSGAEVVMGYDAIAELRTYKNKKIAIVVDSSIYDLEVFKRVETELLAGCEFKVIGRIGREPSMAIIDPLISVIREYDPDIIVAIGGGSTMDSAKVLRVFCEKPDCDWNYIAKGPIENLPNKTQLIAVPTTSGTGSEATACSIITDYNDKKTVIISREISAAKVILDFKLLETLPKTVIAFSGLDVLAHVMGAVTWNPLSPIVKMIGTQVAVTVLKNLVASYNGDPQAREMMHAAAFLAGETIKNASCGLDHNLDRFAKALQIPHGLVSGLLLPYTMEYLIPHKSYTEVAEQMGFSGSETEKQKKLVEYIRTVYKEMNVPLTLREYGVAEEDYVPNIPRYIQECKNIGIIYDVADLTDDDMKKMYMQFYYGLEG